MIETLNLPTVTYVVVAFSKGKEMFYTVVPFNDFDEPLAGGVQRWNAFHATTFAMNYLWPDNDLTEEDTKKEHYRISNRLRELRRSASCDGAMINVVGSINPWHLPTRKAKAT